MSLSTATRPLAAGALAAALSWTGSGTATAAPPPDRVVSVTAGYATTVLRSADGDVAQAVITAPEGSLQTGEVDLYVLGFYHCTSEDPLQATLDVLGGGTLTGELDLTCVWDPDPEDPQPAPGPETVTGKATVGLTWTGTGETVRIPLNGRLDHCVGRFLERTAVVTGEITVEIPEIGFASTLDEPSDSWLRYERAVCPPGGL
jgi:hypothetical protein